jgi:hypothetical protein
MLKTPFMGVFVTLQRKILINAKTTKKKQHFLINIFI